MPDNQPSSDEGADPSADIQKQNPDGKTTADITGGHDDPDRAGAGEGPDAGGDGKAHDEVAPDTKTQDLAKAGRDDVDPDAGQE